MLQQFAAHWRRIANTSLAARLSGMPSPPRRPFPINLDYGVSGWDATQPFHVAAVPRRSVPFAFTVAWFPGAPFVLQTFGYAHLTQRTLTSRCIFCRQSTDAATPFCPAVQRRRAMTVTPLRTCGAHACRLLPHPAPHRSMACSPALRLAFARPGIRATRPAHTPNATRAPLGRANAAFYLRAAPWPARTHPLLLPWTVPHCLNSPFYRGSFYACENCYTLTQQFCVIPASFLALRC